VHEEDDDDKNNMMVIAHNQVQPKTVQEILRVQEEHVSLKHARTSTSNYTKGMVATSLKNSRS
jgi:hypothetical protein